MKHRRSVLSFVFIVSFIMLLSFPLGSHHPGRFTDLRWVYNDFAPATTAQFYVNISDSNVDFSPDKGTHDAFSNQQAGPDFSLDNITEGGTFVPGSDAEDFVDQQSDIHDPSDKGSHSAFSNLQANDSITDSLIEADQAPAASISVGNTTTHAQDASSFSFSHDGQSGTSRLLVVRILTDNGVAVSGTPTYGGDSLTLLGDIVHSGGKPYVAVYYLVNPKTGINSLSGNFASSDKFLVAATNVWGVNSTHPIDGYTEIEGASTSSIRYAEINVTSEAGDLTMDVFTYIGTDIPTVEVGQTQQFNEELGGVGVGDHPGSGSSEPGATLVTMRWNGLTPNKEYVMAAFNINLGSYNDYELDLEVGWTDAPFNELNEELCIRPVTGSGWPAEAINVDVWNGSTWVNLFSGLNPDEWNNQSVSSYLTDGTFEIRFVGGSEDLDGTQSTWEIDAVLLHVWTLDAWNYELDLELQWVNLPTAETNEDLCIYTGILDAEDIRVDVWNGSGWDNLLGDLNGGNWNNVSVKPWLTLSTFTIRFKGGSEVHDPIQSSWYIDVSLVHLYNHIPQIDQQPSISILDDGDNLYANLREYQITMYASDADGHEDITSMRLSLYSDDRSTLYWTLEYDRNTDTFSEAFDPSNYVALNTTGSSATKTGNDIDATFHVSISWSHPHLTNVDTECYVVDSKNPPSTVWYEVTWDIETRLEASGLGLDDKVGTANRGDIDGTFFVSGTITYFNSALIPHSTTVDIWVNSTGYGSTPGPWSDTTLDSGEFNVTCFADNIAGLDNYSVKVVEEGFGAGGSDLLITPAKVSYIADSITVTITVGDSRIDVGTNATIGVSATYDYDLSDFDGDLPLDNTVFNYSTVGLRSYTVMEAANDTQGVSAIGTNQVVNVIWDQLVVTSFIATDSRCDVGTTQSLYVILEYDYDNVRVSDTMGAVYLNEEIMSWEPGLQRWSKNVISSFPINQSFSITFILESQYAITRISGPQGPVVIVWDRLQVDLSSDAAIVNFGDQVNFTVTATRQADGSRVKSLSVSIERNATFYSSSNFTDVWPGPTEAMWRYVVVAATDTEFGLTVFIPDQLDVRWTDRPVVAVDQAFASDPDGRVNVGTTVSIYFHCIWSTNNSAVILGTLDVNSTSYSINGTGWVELSDSSGVISSARWNVTGALVNGVTEYDMRVAMPRVIWDSLTVTIDIGDFRINTGENASIAVSAVHDYDGLPYDGRFALNETTTQDSLVGRRGYTVVSATGGSFGITLISVNSEAYVIWDSLTIDIVVAASRIDVGVNASIVVNAVYNYGGADYDGILVLDKVISPLLQPGLQSYTVTSASSDTYGITEIETNDMESVVWDRLEVFWSEVESERVAAGAGVEVRFRVRYQYDLASFTSFSGELLVNGLSAAYEVVGDYWYLEVSEHSVGEFTYQVSGFSDSTSALTVIVGTNTYASVALFDAVHVDGAGRWDAPASIPLEDTIEARVGESVILYFYLKYQSDESDVTDPEAVLVVNGVPAEFVPARGRWEINVTSTTTGTVPYNIDSFEDSFGITQIDQGEFVPSIEWLSAPITGLPLEIVLIGVGGAAVLVALLVSARRRVARLEEVLTPEELLTLSDVGMSEEMRQQTVANLEWLKTLPDDIPHMEKGILSVIWEELEKARTMYERAFDLDPTATEAGEQIRKTLLERIDSLLSMIEKEVESRG